MLSKADLQTSFGYPVYSSDSTNNGIKGYTNSPEFICDESHPVYITFGDHTRTFNIAKNSFSVLDNVKVLYPCTNDINSILFMLSCWKKQIPNLGYSRHWKVAKNCVISLPITNERNIDFDFISSFIAELEAERVAELEAYLRAGGLKDTTLTPAEQKALNDIETIEWGEYKIGDLFDKLDLKRINKNKFDKNKDLSETYSKDFDLPLVNAKNGNNGIMYYARSADYESAEMSLDIVNDGAISVGNVYAQPQKTGVLYNAYLVKPKHNEITKEKLLFLASCLEKSIKRKFSYDNKAGWNKVKMELICLPLSEEKTIDFDCMETFISAIQKLVIKDVVEYSDNKISATKEVITKNKRA